MIGSPLVDKATIHLDPKFQKGKTFTIVAENNSPKNVYIQSATLNGKPLTRSWFTHDELTAGGELVLKMGPEPNKEWAKAAADRPTAAPGAENKELVEDKHPELRAVHGPHAQARRASSPRRPAWANATKPTSISA